MHGHPTDSAAGEPGAERSDSKSRDIVLEGRLRRTAGHKPFNWSNADEKVRSVLSAAALKHGSAYKLPSYELAPVEKSAGKIKVHVSPKLFSRFSGSMGTAINQDNST